MVLMYTIEMFSFVSCNLAPGSYPYAEQYEIQCEEADLIMAVKKFKAENSDYLVPSQLQIIDGRRDENDYWYHVYFYYKNENQLVQTWIRKSSKGKTTFAFVAINESLTLGNWKNINKDFSNKENKIQKKKFENLLLNKIKVKIQ